VGHWRNVLVVEFPTDVQRIETTWAFDDALRCSRTVDTFSVLEDLLRHSVRPCGYTTNGTRLAVLYDDASERVEFGFTFPDFTRDRLVIGDFEFRRID